MRRTLERSQRVEQRQKRWSWGGLSTDSEGRTGIYPKLRCSEVCVKSETSKVIGREEHDRGFTAPAAFCLQTV